ncbi:hypothetical protein [uncultured Roseobacter sp.]|uniref:hypothetical protein n=1 Tax=uncultured Roseobacter sp. TaxID=114847 RepID=UPI002612FD4D|nr:hypothetical protein [uncultured Roseobacter sp.]
MSVIDEIKQLEAQKQKLLGQAKSEAMKAANKAIADLKALGFEYHLSEGPKPKAKRATTAKKSTRTRRSSVRDDVLKVISNSEAGLVRKEIFTVLNATDKSTKQAVANALAALKKSGELTTEGRIYKAS